MFELNKFWSHCQVCMYAEVAILCLHGRYLDGKILSEFYFCPLTINYVDLFTQYFVSNNYRYLHQYILIDIFTHPVGLTLLCLLLFFFSLVLLFFLWLVLVASSSQQSVFYHFLTGLLVHGLNTLFKYVEETKLQ